MTITFSQLIRNNTINPKPFFELTLKCQRKNCPCLLEKTFLNGEMTELWDWYSAIFRLMGFIFLLKRNISGFRKWLEIFLKFCTTYLCEQSFSSLLLIKNNKRLCLKELMENFEVFFQMFSVSVTCVKRLLLYKCYYINQKQMQGL